MHNNPHIAIVGSGITGLATAWYLQQKIPHADITIFEQHQRIGGKILTEVIDSPLGSAIIEAGPDALLTTKPWALDLINEIGLADQLIPTNTQRRTLYVLRNGQLHPMPSGMQLIIPTQITTFLRSSLFHWHEKLRILAEFFIPARPHQHDESLQDFVVRRFGPAMLDLVAIPLMASIYNADPTTMSMQATFPTYHTLEQQHGSLIRALRSKPPTPRVQSPFVSLRHGMTQLVTHLHRQLRAQIHLNTPVHAISAQQQTCTIHTQQGNHEFTHVVLTTPAHVCAAMLTQHHPTLAAHLAQQRTISTGTVSLLIPASVIPPHIDGFGIVIPRSQGRNFSALTISSVKFAQRAPEQYALVRLFFGRSILLTADDQQVIAAAQSEIQMLFGTPPTIIDASVFRWPNGNPQYDLGHRDWQQRLAEMTPPQLYFAGSSFDGIGIPDCIRQAQHIATTIQHAITEVTHADSTL
jgi:oxygen-dependent protoporphyrinogen oxidase